MKRFLAHRARAALLLVLLGLPFASYAKLNVVATTPDLGAIAREVGGDLVAITILAKPTEDPHFVDAKPNFIVKLNHADALIEGGAELEAGWLGPLLDSARNPKIASGAPGHISCSQGIPLLEVPAALDRSKGDLHAMGNPHFLVDPELAIQVAHTIADAFANLDPASAAVYRSNQDRFTHQLQEKLAAWKIALSPYNGRSLAAFHNTWPYFGKRFELKIEVFLEPKPGIPPTPSHLAETINTIKSTKIPAIIVEPYQNRRTAESVAAKTGVKVLDFAQYPGGIKNAGSSYIELMDCIVSSLVKTFSEKP